MWEPTDLGMMTTHLGVNMKFTGKRKAGFFLSLLSVASLVMSPSYADDTVDHLLTMSSNDWLLNESRTFKASDYCWSKGEKPVLQIKKDNGKWKNTRVVPKFTKASNCDLDYPYEISYRIKPKDFGIQPSAKGVAGMTLRVKSNEGTTKPYEKNVYASEQDFFNLLNELSSWFDEALNDRLENGSSNGSGMSNCTYQGEHLYGSVYFTQYESMADLTVFFTKYESSADLNVYFTRYESSANSCGVWYRTTYQSSADFTVYVTRYESSADLTAYETRYQSSAGT